MTTINILSTENPEKIIRNALKRSSNNPATFQGKQVHSTIYTDYKNLYIKYCKKDNTIWIEQDKNVVFSYMNKNIINSYCELMDFLDNNYEFTI